MCKLFIEELKLAKYLKDVDLFGFCVLLNHMHLLVRFSRECNISEFMRSLKMNFSRNVNYDISNNLKVGLSNPAFKGY